jgi:hypothetical protein
MITKSNCSQQTFNVNKGFWFVFVLDKFSIDHGLPLIKKCHLTLKIKWGFYGWGIQQGLNAKMTKCDVENA